MPGNDVGAVQRWGLMVVSRIALTRPEMASRVEDLLVRMGQAGQIRGQVSDEQLKGLLQQVSQAQGAKRPERGGQGGWQGGWSYDAKAVHLEAQGRSSEARTRLEIQDDMAEPS